MIRPDVLFRRFATLEKEAPDYGYRTVGLENDVNDWFVPEDEWWEVHAVRWRYISVASNLTTNGDILYGFFAFRCQQFTTGLVDVLKRPVGYENLLFGKYVRYGIDYTEPMYGTVFPTPVILPPKSRISLMAQAYGTSLPVYFPEITAPASLDVSIYTLSDDVGITGQGTVQAPITSEWWKQ